MSQTTDQRHPQEMRDRRILAQLKSDGRSDYNLVELARLRIRYRNFPGARAIQTELEQLLDSWQLDEEQLFALTRKIHASGQIYRRSKDGEAAQDWS
ncbi:MAG: DUF3288 family protein [Cyanobacteria bacterium P01_G01_bin.54]